MFSRPINIERFVGHFLVRLTENTDDGLLHVEAVAPSLEKSERVKVHFYKEPSRRLTTTVKLSPVAYERVRGRTNKFDAFANGLDAESFIKWLSEQQSEKVFEIDVSLDDP